MRLLGVIVLGGALATGIAGPVDALAQSAEGVDLRPAFERYGLPLRSQGGRGTCSVFTIVGAIEYALARADGQGETLSVEFLNWASNRAIHHDGDGGFFSDLWKGFAQHGICPEQALPYRARYDRKLQPDEEALNQAKKQLDRGLRLHWVKRWDPSTGVTEEQFREIRRVLQRGWPVCGGFRWPKAERWQSGVLEMAPPEGVFDGHSVLIVGFREDSSQPGGGVFLIRNTGGGLQDSALSYEYLRAYLNDAVWIERMGEGRDGGEHISQLPGSGEAVPRGAGESRFFSGI